MNPDLQLFGLPHLLIVVSILVIAAGLARWCRRSRGAARAIRYSLATFLAANQLIWYIYELRTGEFHFPDGLPL